MSIQEGTPPLVAHGCGACGRSDDVGEEHSGQDPIDRGSGPFAREELGNLVKELVIGNHVSAGQLDELCPWNVFCDVAPALDGRDAPSLLWITRVGA